MVYADDKPVLLVCDDTVFVKILPELETLMQHAEKGFPYDGAKEMLLVDEVDDKEFLAKLFEATYDELPSPKR